jgi:hypothetical protein
LSCTSGEEGSRDDSLVPARFHCLPWGLDEVGRVEQEGLLEWRRELLN